MATPKLRANRRVLRALRQALHAAKMADCTVEEKHKEAMRLYLKTWVVGPLEDAIADMRGEKHSRW